MSAPGRFDLSAARLELLTSLLRDQGIERSPSQLVMRRADPAAPVPLTFPQSRLWFLESFAAHNSAYVISAGLRVHGEFRLDVFARACDQVVRRHESLRTVFFEVDGRPMQQVREHLRTDVKLVDLQPLTPRQAQAEVARHEAELVDRPFDLQTGPPFRAVLLQLAAQQAVVMLSMHHLVSDRWSMGVLMRELIGSYAALVTGSAPDLPELAVQYPDFAVWQQGEGSDPAWASDLAYWSGQLRGAPADVGLATQYRRPKEKSYRGASVPVRLPAPLTAQLRALAQAENATPFMVLLAAFNTLIWRLSDTEDIVVGTPVANRTLVELEPLIGFFVNTLALRTDLSGDPPVRDLLRRVVRVCLDGYEHQRVPFERLVEDLAPERSLARTPVFQVMISYQNVPFPRLTGLGEGSLRVEPMPLESQKAEFDLMLDLFEDGDTIWGRLEYSSDLFDASGAQAIVELFGRLVDAAVTDPDQRIGGLPRLDGLDGMVALRGPRAELDDVEAVLAANPRVAEAAVTARVQKSGETRLTAYLTAGPERPRTGELIAELKRQFPDYLVPATYVLLVELPRTSDGHVDRAALPDVELILADLATSFVPPRNELERSIAQLWQVLLGVAQVGAHDDFFALGGHSLLATKLMSHLQTSLRVKVPIRILFDGPTIAELADWIADQPESIHSTDAIPVVSRDNGVMLSFAQQRLRQHHPVPVDDAYHNVVTAVTLRGGLDEAALRHSLDDLVRRHEALRPPGDVDPIWPLAGIDLRADDEPARAQRLRQIVTDETKRPFDSASEPLIRATLIALAPDENVLILVMHHLVTDNWSYGVLVRDLCELYEAHVLGRDQELPALAIQYPDFAAWQQQQLASGALDEDAAYWRAQLADLPTPLRFQPPTAPDAPAATGHTLAFSLDPAATEALTAIGRSTGATLFMVLIAAFDLLLSAHSNQNDDNGDDIVVSYPVAGRERPETADLVGYFVNNLVVRADLSGDPTFRELIGQVRHKTLDGYAHQGFPLWSLKPEWPGRDPFRIIFNLLNASVPAQNLHGLQTSPLHLDIGSEYVFAEVVASLTPADVDLALIMREDGGGLRGLWLYSLERVDPQAMAAMMHRWARLIEVVTADPDRPASQLRGD